MREKRSYAQEVCVKSAGKAMQQTGMIWPGCRIGVAGCRGPGGFSAVTSLNLRIARWLTCPLPSELEAYIATPAGGLLLAGVVGYGLLLTGGRRHGKKI